jgi:hypothetical protein
VQFHGPMEVMAKIGESSGSSFLIRLLACRDVLYVMLCRGVDRKANSVKIRCLCQEDSLCQNLLSV